VLFIPREATVNAVPEMKPSEMPKSHICATGCERRRGAEFAVVEALALFQLRKPTVDGAVIICQPFCLDVQDGRSAIMGR
jgi:hypothetical protein